MTNTHMQRKIQGRDEENVERDELHQGLQNNSSQSEDLESLTMSEVSSRAVDNSQNRISTQLHFIYLWIDRKKVSLMHLNLVEQTLRSSCRLLRQSKVELYGTAIKCMQALSKRTTGCSRKKGVILV